MSTIFIAVECCQCSIMQVKQRKQSSKSNKWTCVVCNQKQSVRQVFAQGPMAKDLRLFVLSSNMSRQSPHQAQHQQQIQNTLVSSVSPQTSQKKRRTDWTQYLDPEDDLGTNIMQEDEDGYGFEPEIVAELQADLFKKPKLNNDKPVFSQRNFNKHVVYAEDKEQRKDELTIIKENSKLNQLMIWDDQEAGTYQMTKATCRGTSKWNDYITEDDDDELRLMNRRKCADNAGRWNNEMSKTLAKYDYETVTNDERVVEDDIHPDFLQGSVVSKLGES